MPANRIVSFRPSSKWTAFALFSLEKWQTVSNGSIKFSPAKKPRAWRKSTVWIDGVGPVLFESGPESRTMWHMEDDMPPLPQLSSEAKTIGLSRMLKS